MTSTAKASWDMLDLIHACIQAPSYHVIAEVLLVLWIVQLLLKKSYKPGKNDLTEKEKADLIESYQPEPLVPDVPEDHPILQNMFNRIIDGKIGNKLSINGRECINAATLNFLNMVGRPEIEDLALKCMRKYGVGPCGPRGFYGTLDVHLELEKRLADFMQVEDVAVYPYGFAVMSTVIPAYSKRADIIFCDDGANFAIQQGLVGSRSQVVYYKHNDMEDLERVLKQQARSITLIFKLQKGQVQDEKKAAVVRRFLVSEGLSIKFGDICPLPKLVELKEKYKLRLFLDESLSFGVMGKTGKGLTEYFNVPVEDIDFLCMSLENALGCGGGFCCGKSYVVDFQRLNSLGYAFSCSIPAMLSQAGNAALGVMQKSPELIEQLKQNSKYMHQKLQQLKGMKVLGCEESPIHLLQLQGSSTYREDESLVLAAIVSKAEDRGVALTTAAYLDEERFLPPPSIRLAVNCEMSEAEMDHIVSVIQECAREEMLY